MLILLLCDGGYALVKLKVMGRVNPPCLSRKGCDKEGPAPLMSYWKESTRDQPSPSHHIERNWWRGGPIMLRRKKSKRRASPLILLHWKGWGHTETCQKVCVWKRCWILSIHVEMCWKQVVIQLNSANLYNAAWRRRVCMLPFVE